MLVVGLRCWRNSSFSRPGEGTSPARSPPARESGTHRELREGPVKFIPYFSPLHPPLAAAGTLACRVGSGVYLMTPFAGVSVGSHRLSPASPPSLPPWDQPGPAPRCAHASARSGTWVPIPAGLGSESTAPSGTGRGGGRMKQAQARETPSRQ